MSPGESQIVSWAPAADRVPSSSRWLPSAFVTLSGNPHPLSGSDPWICPKEERPGCPQAGMRSGLRNRRPGAAGSGFCSNPEVARTGAAVQADPGGAPFLLLEGSLVNLFKGQTEGGPRPEPVLLGSALGPRERGGLQTIHRPALGGRETTSNSPQLLVALSKEKVPRSPRRPVWLAQEPRSARLSRGPGPFPCVTLCSAWMRQKRRVSPGRLRIRPGTCTQRCARSSGLGVS